MSQNNNDNSWLKHFSAVVAAGLTAYAAKKAYEDRDKIKQLYDEQWQGVPFMILGALGAGKTSLFKWVQTGDLTIPEREYNPTQPNYGENINESQIQIGRSLRIQSTLDLSGDYNAMLNLWDDAFSTVKPQGLIFIIDYETNHDEQEGSIWRHKQALSFVTNMLHSNESYRQRLKAFHVLYNKEDVWRDHITIDQLQAIYADEMEICELGSDRYSYRFQQHVTSLVTGYGVNKAMRSFFDDIAGV